MFQPLKGTRIIDLSQVLAGPFATYQMALMGAEVIKIEKPGEGDWTRDVGPLANLAKRKMGLAFLTQNADKKSVTIDLKKPAGLALAKKLIASADVFVENFKPGVADRLGLSFDVVREINPKIVYCSISAFGQNGPLSARPAYDHVIQGMCGIMRTTGKPGDGPTKVGSPYVDFATGMNAAMAVMAGLTQVQRTQTAIRLDVAMLDTALMLMASLMSQTLSADWTPTQNGNEAWSASPSSGAFETSDGLLMLAANNNAQFKKLCRAIGHPEFVDQPRWQTPAARAQHSHSLRKALDEIFLTQTADYWETLLAKADVPAARVRRLDEVLAEPQVQARELTSAMQVAGHQEDIHVPALSFRADGASIAPRTPPPELGAHTAEVLGEAGITSEQLTALRHAGVI